MILPPPGLSKKRNMRLEIIKGFKRALRQSSFVADRRDARFFIERKSLGQGNSWPEAFS
jgi:hypothetical protein